MAAPSNFRSAFHGFNREDVVHYIEFLNSKHLAETNQLKSEIQSLQEELEQLRSMPAAPTEPEICCEKPLQETAEASEEILQPAPKAVKVVVKPADKELEAYRRAERAERLARERANQIVQQATALIADATVQIDTAALSIETVSADAAAQIAQLQTSITESRNILREISASMAAIRPEEE